MIKKMWALIRKMDKKIIILSEKPKNVIKDNDAYLVIEDYGLYDKSAYEYNNVWVSDRDPFENVRKIANSEIDIDKLCLIDLQNKLKDLLKATIKDLKNTEGAE